MQPIYRTVSWLDSHGEGFSPDGRYLAHGNGETFVYDTETGESLGPVLPPVAAPAPKRRVWPCGWFDTRTLLVVQSLSGEGTDTRQTYLFDVVARSCVPFAELEPGEKRVRAGRNGYWAYAIAGGPIYYNGTRLPMFGAGWRITLDEGILAFPSASGIQVWIGGLPARAHEIKGVCKDLTLCRGMIGYGEGLPRRISATGEDQDVTITPWRKESSPVLVEDPAGVMWTWTLSDDAGRFSVIGRPGTGPACLVVPLDTEGACLDVACRNGRWLIASRSNVGALCVYAVPVDTLPAPLPGTTIPEPPGPTPEPRPDPVLPPFGHKVEVGLFHFDSVRYGDYRDLPEAPSPDDPGAYDRLPCTLSVITDAGAYPAEYGLPMIVSPECLFVAAQDGEFWRAAWARVQGVYIAAEDSVADLTTMARVAGLLMDELGLPRRPFVSYTGGALFPMALGPTDIIGVQLYLAPGQGPDALRALAARVMPTVEYRRVAIISQCYNRNGAYREDLTALQPVYAAIVAQHANVEYLLQFSDGRLGGSRSYPALRPWQRAISRAARRWIRA